MIDMNKPSEEQVQKLTSIIKPVSDSINLLMEYQNREASLAITRLQEGILWAQQAILNEKAESKALD